MPGANESGLGSGDVVLFSGSHPLHLVQRERTGSPWGQVGLILRLPNDLVCVFESTKIATCTDVLLGKVVRGVQWVRLSERVSSFDGAVAIRRLEPRLSESMADRLLSFAREVHGLPFNDSKWTALRSIRRRNPPRTCTSFFCSELAAEAYQRTGLLPPPPRGRSSNNYIPADFSDLYSDGSLPLEGGFRLGVESHLKPSAHSNDRDVPPALSVARPCKAGPEREPHQE